MYIGSKQVKDTKDTGETTPGGTTVLEVVYDDDTLERFSKVMYDQVLSEHPCDATELRDKRVQHVVSLLLAVLREYGLKVGDTPYLSVLLNNSLNANVEEATKELWATWMPKPPTLDDVDLVTVDRILTSKKQTLDDVLNGTTTAK